MFKVSLNHLATSWLEFISNSYISEWIRWMRYSTFKVRYSTFDLTKVRLSPWEIVSQILLLKQLYVVMNSFKLWGLTSLSFLLPHNRLPQRKSKRMKVLFGIIKIKIQVRVQSNKFPEKIKTLASIFTTNGPNIFLYVLLGKSDFLFNGLLTEILSEIWLTKLF